MSHTYEYARPSVTVDIVIVTGESEPKVLLIRRKKEPFIGTWVFEDHAAHCRSFRSGAN